MHVKRPFIARPSAMDGAHSRTLARALEIVVSKEALAEAIGVGLEELEGYLAGAKPLPQWAFLKAIDIVAGKPPAG
jgi:hypothetical protein